MKTSLILVVLVLLACLVLIGSRSEEPVAASVSQTSRGPSFEVRVVFPRLNRPFFGMLPESLVVPVGGIPRELRFDHASPGAQIVSVGPDRLELRAHGWDLSIATDGAGRVAPETHLELPLDRSGHVWRLRCRPGAYRPGPLGRWLRRPAPADRAPGHLRATTRAGGGEMDGSFLFELASCENAESGKAVDFPAAPLTVSGSFEGLPRDAG